MIQSAIIIQNKKILMILILYYKKLNLNKISMKKKKIIPSSIRIAAIKNPIFPNIN